MSPVKIAPFAAGVIAAVAGYTIETQNLASWVFSGPDSSGFALIGYCMAAWGVAFGVIGINRRLGIAVTAAGAAFANGYLFTQKWAAEDAVSLCSANEVINCAAVNDSVYSEAFGIPITLFGLAFYVALAVAAAFKRESTPHLYTVTIAFMIPSLLYSVFLAYISKTIGAFCMFCISIYVANIWLLIAALWGQRSDLDEEPFNAAAALTGRAMMAVASIFVVGTIAGYSVWQGKQNSGAAAVVAQAVQSQQAIPQDALSTMYSRALGPVELDDTEPVLGDPKAKYMVVEFADFGCGHCARAAPDLKALVESNPDIQLRFRAFALSAECNPALSGEGRSEPCQAAMAAECAHQQGKFWEFTSKVFKNQRFLDPGSLAFQAEDSGMDMATYEQCLANPETLSGIEADGQAGGDAGIQGTPGLFLFGVRPEPIFVNGRVEYIEALIDAVESGRTLPPGGEPHTH